MRRKKRKVLSLYTYISISHLSLEEAEDGGAREER